MSDVIFISVVTDLTMGGVFACLALLGNVNIVEPTPLVRFADPGVIE